MTNHGIRRVCCLLPVCVANILSASSGIPPLVAVVQAADTGK